MKSTLNHVTLLLKRLGFVLLLYFICRVVFLTLNYPAFESTALTWAFYGGLWFDLSAIAIINLPIIFLSLFPGPWLSNSGYQRFLMILIALINFPGILLNLIDCQYFKFTSKRATADFFELIALGDDMVNLIPTFLVDYWFLTLLFIVMILAAVRWIKRADLKLASALPINYILMPLAMLLMIGLAVLTFRGGTQLRPMDNLSAMKYGRPQDLALIINTPFSVLKSWNKAGLERRSYFAPEELDAIYTPIHEPSNKTPNKENVVLIIMESFTKEYVGQRNENGLQYTPFLDSLSRVASSFEHSYANGRKSIEALPAILSGLPALMNEPIITSPYTGQKSDALPRVLKKHGYTSSFFHGGRTGTMGFDKYCQAAGFDQYIGLEDYPDISDYDDNWGIYDEPFFQYFAEQISEMPEPYLATVFSLSSHHPYAIPDAVISRYAGFEHGLGQSIRYADDALRYFFKTMKRKGLLDNTLFVITADHTPNTTNTDFLTPLGSFSVPIVLYHTEGLQTSATVAQQADIQSTVIDFLDLPDGFVGFGKSLISSPQNWSLQFINEMYQLREGDYLLRYDGREHIDLTQLSAPDAQAPSEIEEEMLARLQAMIQQFNDRMIDNRMSFD